MKVLDYILHTRPQSIPVTFFAVFTGYALSPNKPTELIAIFFDLIVLIVIFSIVLWGGTNAFNSGQDGDVGALTLLPNPPKVPKYLSQFGIGLMILAIILAYFINAKLMYWTLAGVILSIYYSWKNDFIKRGKDIPILDMLINTVGFGFSSILFGYLMTSEIISSDILLIGVGFTFAYMGGMPTSQIFQLKESTPTKDYTSLLGASNVLRIGALFFLLHIFFLTYAFVDFELINQNLTALLCWIGWLILVIIAAIHSFIWSKNPFKNPYNKMNRQMVMMMLSQLLWTVYAWIIS